MNTGPRISCAICQKPVDRLEWETEEFGRRLIVRAYCHGDVDTMQLDAWQMHNMREHDLQEGVAFETKRITT